MEEVKKKRQVMRYSDQELQLIKGVFAENDELLKSIRKVFYQMPLTAVDLSRLSITFNGKEGVQKVLRKTLLPTIDAEMPLQQNIDLWLTMKLKEMMVEEASVHLDSVNTWIKYIDQQLKVIESGKYSKKPTIRFKDLENIKDKPAYEKFADMLARNTIVNHVEQQLKQLEILGGLKEESPEQTIERLSKDSSK